MFSQRAICFHNATCIAVAGTTKTSLIGVVMIPVIDIIRMDKKISTGKLDNILRLNNDKKRALRTRIYITYKKFNIKKSLMSHIKYCNGVIQFFWLVITMLIQTTFLLSLAE